MCQAVVKNLVNLISLIYIWFVSELVPQRLEKASTGKTILKSGTDTSPSLNLAGSESGLMSSYYVGLGSDNVWYMFLGQSVRSIHDSNSLQKLEHLGQEDMGTFLKKKLQTDSPAWKEAGKSGFSLVWSAGSSIDTWTWKGKVPLLQELAKGWEVKSCCFLCVEE